jgi:hypothetical protein
MGEVRRIGLTEAVVTLSTGQEIHLWLKHDPKTIYLMVDNEPLEYFGEERSAREKMGKLARLLAQY